MPRSSRPAASWLLEKPGRRAGQAIGRSPYMQSVCVEDGASHIGAMVDVEIVGLGPNSLRGRVVTPTSQVLGENRVRRTARDIAGEHSNRQNDELGLALGES